MEKISLLFSRLKEMSLWQRLFSWSGIKSLAVDAFAELRGLTTELENTKRLLDEQKNRVTDLTVRNESLTQRMKDIEVLSARKDAQIEELNSRVREQAGTITEMNRQKTLYEASREERVKEYYDNITRLNQVKDSLESERKRLSDDRVKETEERFENMKKTWAEHETDVKNTIIRICDANHVTYVEKVPFRGNPDNTIEIAGEYIIFDAKSPASDNLLNFPIYIKAQTESVKKYASQENVKKSIFLIVPTNTIDSLKQVTYKMGDYDVFIITKDSLEPVILSLKKIEEYDLAEKLSPEDRDSICRIIGKFAHTAKRRIQIDQFFWDEFIDIVLRSEKELPEDIHKKVIDFEKSEKLNPPTEKRAKLISIDELQKRSDEISAEAQIRRLSSPESE